MDVIFLKLLNLSITASWLILAVAILRPMIRKAPKWITCALWAFVGFRLICPFSLESALSLIPSVETIPYDIAMKRTPAIDSGIPAVNQLINPVISESFTADPVSSANPLQILIPVASFIWITGVVLLLLYAFISYVRIKRSVGAFIDIADHIRACDEVKSPFILGIFRPVIYVPASMTGETLDCVITHENAHLKRHDHWWKPLGYILLSVYWFNPFCWVAYILLCRDIEMACDEKVIRDMDKEGKAAYSQALLNVNFPRRKIAACPLAFGEIGVKERVKSILNYRKPTIRSISITFAACAVVAVCFLTNPLAENSKPDSPEKVDRSVFYGEELLDYLAALPEEAERLSERGSFVMSNKGNIYGDEHLSDFLNLYSSGKATALTIGQYTTEGDLILYYVACDGKDIIITIDSRRDKFADPAQLIEEERYHYFSLLEWTGADGSIYEEIVAHDDPDLTHEKMMQILASSEYSEGQKKQFIWIGSFVNGTTEKTSGSDMAFNFKSVYIGDAPKVSAIAHSLPYPEGYECSGIELQTDEEPYELEIFLTGEGSIGPDDFTECSRIVFESIGNLSIVRFADQETGEILFAHSEPESLLWEEADLMDEVLWDGESTEDPEWNISASDGAVSIIGGADGPTSIFVAGKLGDSMEPEINFSERNMETLYSLRMDSYLDSAEKFGEIILTMQLMNLFPSDPETVVFSTDQLSGNKENTILEITFTEGLGVVDEWKISTCGNILLSLIDDLGEVQFVFPEHSEEPSLRGIRYYWDRDAADSSLLNADIKEIRSDYAAFQTIIDKTMIPETMTFESCYSEESYGPEEDAWVVMPDLMGLTAAEALERCAVTGVCDTEDLSSYIILDDITGEELTQISEEMIVMEQKPLAGSKVPLAKNNAEASEILTLIVVTGNKEEDVSNTSPEPTTVSDEELLAVTLVQQYTNGYTDEKLKASQENGLFQSAERKEDGSIVLYMTETQYEDYLRSVETGMLNLIEMLELGQMYGVTNIQQNEDFSSFEITVKSKTLNTLNADSASYMLLTYSRLYQYLLTGIENSTAEITFLDPDGNVLAEAYVPEQWESENFGSIPMDIQMNN